jgi:exonuclease III
LCGDVETNPGPNELTLMTQNCRGLSDYNKLRAILRNKSKMFTKSKAVLALQETYLMNDDMIKWSGNYVMSASASPHSAGCITYLNDYVRVIEVRQIDNFGHGHVIVMDNFLLHPTILANVYSPVRSNGREQESFYNDLFNIIEELERKYLFNKPNLIILGDFNIPLELSNHHNNDGEAKRAKKLIGSIEQKGLIDCWKKGDDRFTYRTARSRLDRITYRLELEYTEKLETDWTFTISDHCLLKVMLTPKSSSPSQSRVTSLPTFLLENEELLNMMKCKMNEMVHDSINHWEPNVKLEYLKMCLRTVAGEVTKYYNNKINKELTDIKKGISWRMNRISSLPLYAHAENDLQLDLLFTRRNLILEERNKKLAEKAKTKWFHEGEKANKYFLNLLNKRRGTSNIDRLSEGGSETTEVSEINTAINNFYK